MIKLFFPAVLVLLCSVAIFTSCAAATGEFSFGVIAHPINTNTDESVQRNAIHESDTDNLAFVVANGIKSNLEPCNDNIYLLRKMLFDSAQNGLILSVTASDWSECKNAVGRSAAVERLNRIRDLFFSDDYSFGASKIPLVRQAASPRFRSYGENMRWELNTILFATLNLPRNNNNFLAAAGRNNEFEDRLIANQDWLQRIVTYAAHKKINGIVIFCDADPLALTMEQGIKRDGFFEVRRQLNALAAKFSGKILIIHNQPDVAIPTNKVIKWQENIGELGMTSGWMKITVTPSAPVLFSIGDNAIALRNTRQ